MPVSIYATTPVDDPNPAALAAPRDPPANLMDPAGAAHHVTRFRVVGQRLLQCSIFVVRQILVNEGREQCALDERQHSGSEYTSKT